MTIILYLVLASLLLWGLVTLYLRHLARKGAGTSAARLLRHMPELQPHQGKGVLVYFYSPHCGPCKQMSPLVDELRAAGEPIYKFDISRDIDMARELSVCATPAVVHIRDAKVVRCHLGRRSASGLRRLLQPISQANAD